MCMETPQKKWKPFCVGEFESVRKWRERLFCFVFCFTHTLLKRFRVRNENFLPQVHFMSACVFVTVNCVEKAHMHKHIDTDDRRHMQKRNKRHSSRLTQLQFSFIASCVLWSKDKIHQRDVGEISSHLKSMWNIYIWKYYCISNYTVKPRTNAHSQ
jgi:hypothetical protein